MKSRFVFIFALGLFLSSLNLKVYANTKAGNLKYISGTVILTRGTDILTDLKVPYPVEVGDLIQTASNSLAIVKLEDGSTLKLEEESILSLDQISLINGSSESIGDEQVVTKLFLKSGAVFLEVAKKIEGLITTEVQTQNDVSFGVRGTVFMVGVDEDTNSWASLKEGEVEVLDNKNDDHEILKPEEGILIENGKLTKPDKVTWGKSLNWNFAGNGQLVSSFRKARIKRIEEFKKRASILRKRERRPFKKRHEQMRMNLKKRFGGKRFEDRRQFREKRQNRKEGIKRRFSR